MRPIFFLVAWAGCFFGEAAASERDTQLTQKDIDGFEGITFASAAASRRPNPPCKVFLDEPDWPSLEQWSKFNTSVDGALLQPLPPAAVCYRTSPAFDAAQCEFLLTSASRTSFYLDHPSAILNQWPQGNTCLAARNATGNCTLGGFPVYVVNATTVKQVQAAVNFARNRNVRLIIKYGIVSRRMRIRELTVLQKQRP